MQAAPHPHPSGTDLLCSINCSEKQVAILIMAIYHVWGLGWQDQCYDCEDCFIIGMTVEKLAVAGTTAIWEAGPARKL